MTKSKIKKYKTEEDTFFETCDLKREEHFIKVKNYEINVRVQSLGKGKPLFFIHGGPNAGSTWFPLVSLLSDYQIILLDRPGCGLSEAVSYEDLTNKKLTELIVAVIDSVLDYFKIDKSFFVGSSFGGYWILKYTLNRPQRVEKLVLESCPAMVEGMKIPKFMQSLKNPFMKWLIPKLPTTKAYSKKILKDIGHTYSIENNIIPEIFINWYVSLCNNTDTTKNDISVISKAIKGDSIDPEFMLYDNEISKIQHPALWLWGTDDAFGGLEIGNRLNSIMKNSTIFGFENSGHLPWLDKPKEHAEKIKNFI